jgi:selenocysteine lyase/cysteine desulfurase
MFTNHNPLYLDNACTTPTLKVATDTYCKFAGTCLGRSDYPLAIESQKITIEARKLVKQWFNIKEDQMDDWQVVFGYNTTDLINKFRIALENTNTNINSGIGHNSVSLQGDPKTNFDWSKNIVTLYSNIDGLEIANDLISSICICDLAQGFFSFDKQIDSGKIYIFSAHKIYSTHLGVALIHKDLLNTLIPPFIGGGTISDTDGRHYTLYNNDEAYKSWEAGLQDTGSTCALGATIKELIGINAKERYIKLTEYTKNIKELLVSKGYKIASTNPDKHSSIVSFFDPNDLGRIWSISENLAKYGISCRAGNCCGESWLNEYNFPPVVRLSLGLNYTEHLKVLQILNGVL